VLLQLGDEPVPDPGSHQSREAHHRIAAALPPRDPVRLVHHMGLVPLDALENRRLGGERPGHLHLVNDPRRRDPAGEPHQSCLAQVQDVGAKLDRRPLPLRQRDGQRPRVGGLSGDLKLHSQHILGVKCSRARSVGSPCPSD
jgi:hypothetical protein